MVRGHCEARRELCPTGKGVNWRVIMILNLARARIFVLLVGAVALPREVAAQHPHYKLIEIPTLGGPGAIGQVDGPGISQFINNSGVVVGGIDTPAPDPFC